MSIKSGSARPSPELQTALELSFLSLALYLSHALDAAAPYMDAAWGVGMGLWQLVEPHADSILPIAFGLLLIFFGGSLPLTIAAFEAFRLCGWGQTRAKIIVLWEQFKVPTDVLGVAQEANAKDDKKDENNDGGLDLPLEMIDGKALITRKVALMLRVTDPGKVQEAVTGILTGTSAVVATLRHEFAQSIALGVSLGDMFTRTADHAFRPALERAIPREYHKWIPMIISLLCRGVAVHIAWWCQRIISAVHSSMRGSDLLLHGVFSLLDQNHIRLPMGMSPSHPSYPAAVAALAVLGFYIQLSQAFGIPFPLNLLLLPLRIGELVLSWTLAYGPK